jgi:hypothetical protein
MSTGLWTGYRRVQPPPRDIPRRHEQQSIQTISQTGLSLSLEDLKDDLRIRHSELDKHLLGEIDTAVNHVELAVFRTCRPLATYRMTDRMWPTNRDYTPNAQWFWWPTSTGNGIMYFFMPPLRSVDLLRYIDGTTRSATFDATTISADVITFDSAPSWLATGLEMTLDIGAGTADSGMTDGATYWIRAVTTTTIQLYTTLADALADTNAVTLSDDGTGTQTLSTIQQVLPSDEYNVVISTKTRSFLEFDNEFFAPSLADRPDSVIYDYTCGYGDRQSITTTITKAIAFMVAYFVDGRDEDYKAAQRLIDINDWGSYS